MADAEVASIARNLANALSDFAYSRKDTDKARIAEFQHELCQAVKAEATELPMANS